MNLQTLTGRSSVKQSAPRDQPRDSPKNRVTAAPASRWIGKNAAARRAIGRLGTWHRGTSSLWHLRKDEQPAQSDPFKNTS